MGNACQNQHQNATTCMHNQEQESISKEDNLILIQNMNPNIKKYEYLVENLNEGIGASTITEIVVKPRNQAQVLEVLRGIKNAEIQIRFNKQQEQGLKSSSSKNDSKRSSARRCQSEKHVHFQIPQMQIVKNQNKFSKKCKKK